MKNKLLPILIILIIITAVISCTLLVNVKPQTVDTIKLNELKKQVEDNEEDYNKIDSLGFNIVVISSSGRVLYSNSAANANSYDEWINYAYRQSAVIMDYSDGKILVFKKVKNTANTLITVIIAF